MRAFGTDRTQTPSGPINGAPSMSNLLETRASRRSFLSVSAGLFLYAGFMSNPVSRAVAAAVEDYEVFSWMACVINCGNRCPLRAYTRNGQVIRIETDDTRVDGDGCSPRQIRACLKGRSMRQRLYSPDRLKFPMRRVGERGDAKFERITWDEAFETIAREWTRIRDTYGNEAIYWQYCSGQQSLVNSRRAWQRLMNLMGGYLRYYGSYSSAQISAAFPMTYGKKVASAVSEIGKAKLYVAFGNNPSVTRGSGGSKSYQWACEVAKNNVRTIIIDPMCSDTVAGKADQWIPIRPGTDAALVEAIAYELITNNWVDQKFLDEYCIGYDEKTLPEGAPAKSDYRSYILGESEDKTPKTPERASGITGIPVDVIRTLAKEIGTTKPLFVAQGLGPQRQANGEQTARAIAMLPILTGCVGLPGTSTGMEEDGTNWEPTYLPVGTNKVDIRIPVFLWTDAIVRGTDMTALTDGVKGVDRLRTPIKMIVNSGGNVLINQHSDSNRTDKILRDATKCEFIVVCDNMMTPSARYADILLPDTLGPETDDIVGNGDSMGDLACLYPMHKAVEPQWEQKPSWEICQGIARKLGLEDAYMEGRDQKGWIRWCYEETRKDNPELPDFDVFWKQGPTQLFNVKWNRIMFEDFRKDPKGHPLNTPSGKVEIYSSRLAQLASEWKLPEGDVISALPKFVRTWDMPGDEAQKKYPLQMIGFHGHGRTHSTFHNLPWLREVHPDVVTMNRLDAESRGIAEGDLVQVWNDRGMIELPAHVTERIMPGVCAIPQGAWYKPVVKEGRIVDVGGCINTITSQRPSPLAKGNPQHTNLVEVRKA